jgi:hypothetical protein
MSVGKRQPYLPQSNGLYDGGQLQGLQVPTVFYSRVSIYEWKALHVC